MVKMAVSPSPSHRLLQFGNEFLLPNFLLVYFCFAVIGECKNFEGKGDISTLLTGLLMYDIVKLALIIYEC